MLFRYKCLLFKKSIAFVLRLSFSVKWTSCFLSLHWLHPRGLWGKAIWDLPAVCRWQLWPKLLLQSVLRRTHGVPGPGIWNRRGGPDLDHWPQVPDGRDQWRGQLGKEATHPRSISFTESSIRAASTLMRLCPTLLTCLKCTLEEHFVLLLLFFKSIHHIFCSAFLNQSFVTWLKQTFTEADKNGDGSLSINEVLQLLHKLNVNLPRQKVKQMFKVLIKFLVF